METRTYKVFQSDRDGLVRLLRAAGFQAGPVATRGVEVRGDKLALYQSAEFIRDYFEDREGGSVRVKLCELKLGTRFQYPECGRKAILVSLGPSGARVKFEDGKQSVEFMGQGEAVRFNAGNQPVLVSDESEVVVLGEVSEEELTRLAAPKGERPSKRASAVVEPDKARAAWTRIMAGESLLIRESKALGFSNNNPLRQALRLLLGADAYAEAMRGLRPRGKQPPPNRAGNGPPGPGPGQPPGNRAGNGPGRPQAPSGQGPQGQGSLKGHKPGLGRARGRTRRAS